MCNASGEQQFTLETGGDAGNILVGRANDFQGNSDADIEVVRFIDLAHSSPLNESDDPKTIRQKFAVFEAMVRGRIPWRLPSDIGICIIETL